MNTRKEVMAWLDENAPYTLAGGHDEPWRSRVTFPSGLNLSIQTSAWVAGSAFCEIGLPSRDIPECTRGNVMRLTWHSLARLIARENLS